MGSLNTKNISVIGFGVGSAYSSLWLDLKNINHRLLLQQQTVNFLDINPVSNPIISGTSLKYEKQFLNENLFTNLIYLKGYSFSFFDQNFNPLLSVSGNYKTSAYAMDNRLKWDALYAKLQTLKHATISYCNQIDLDNEIKSEGIKIIGGGKNYTSYFTPIEGLNNVVKPSRKIIFFNIKLKEDMLKKMDLNSIFFVAKCGEILVYPFKHKDNCNALNITIEIIDKSTFDVFNENDSHSESYLKLKNIIKSVSLKLYDIIKDADLLDNIVTKTQILPHYKNPTHSFSDSNLIFGIGDSICLNDPITGQGYNTSLKVSKIFVDFFEKYVEQSNSHEKLKEYQNQMIHLIKILYELNLNLTIGNSNKMLPELLILASRNQKLASFLGETFDDVELLFPWYNNQESTTELIKKFEIHE